MKKLAIVFYLLALIGIKPPAQKYNNSSSFKSDSGYIFIDGGKLFYETAGDGEYIVLLHDGMVSHEIWDTQFDLLAKKYRLVRYDRRAYGKSSDPQANYSHIEDLNRVFKQLKI